MQSLPELQSILIPRCYINLPASDVKRRELHIFSDASQRANYTVAYLKMYSINGDHHVSFIHRKAKCCRETDQGGTGKPEIWAVIFTCLVCRAIHLEVLEELSSSSQYDNSGQIVGQTS